MTAGFTLSDIPGRVNWRAVHALYRHSCEGSAIRSAADEDSYWTLATEQQAQVIDLLHVLVWMKTKDGQSNRRRPKPFPRPKDQRNGLAMAKAAGVVDQTGSGEGDGRVFGGASMDIDETRKWLGW